MYVDIERMKNPPQITIKPAYFERMIRIEMGVNPALVKVDDCEALIKELSWRIPWWRTQFIFIEVLQEIVEKRKRMTDGEERPI